MKKRSLIRVEGGLDNLVHIEPSVFMDYSATMCGEVNNHDCNYTPVNKKVTCHMCLSEFEALRHGLKIIKIK